MKKVDSHTKLFREKYYHDPMKLTDKHLEKRTLHPLLDKDILYIPCNHHTENTYRHDIDCQYKAYPGLFT